MKKTASGLLILTTIFIFSCQQNGAHLLPGVKVSTNQVGYDSASYKQAIISADSALDFTSFDLLNVKNDSVVFSGKPAYKGGVDQWNHWKFWTMNFSDFTTPGNYFIRANTKNGVAYSLPFKIGNDVLERYTLSNVIYYFKGQRCSGVFEQADSHLPVPGSNKTIDVRGGWYDATGDYGIHFTQLSMTNYFNTQQVPLVAWTLLKSYQELQKRNNINFSQYERRLVDEGMFGADFLVRMHIPGSSFYVSINAPGADKAAKDRRIAVVIPPAAFKKLGHVFHPQDNLTAGLKNLKPEIASFRAGGGVAIAALALASTFTVSGDFTQKQYLAAAEDAYNFLQKNNDKVTNDGKNNILDDYCALLASTELYKASHKPDYLQDASVWADSLMNRLTTWKDYKDYWRANAGDRPFFNPSDAGLPVVSLLDYYDIADATTKEKILDVVKKSMQFYLNITSEVTNPFGYARQLVQDTTGKRYTTFFFPHNTETGFWWQGENARLASLATAARMSAPYFKQTDPKFATALEDYAWNQLNWILGLNPYNSCMLIGSGYNNPQYDFRGTWQYTSAPGAIVNGITSGMDNQQGIAYEIPFSVTHHDNDWRWEEQWLPHAAWYMLAVSVGQ